MDKDNFQIGSRVTLTSFLGLLSHRERGKPQENYWLLIGNCGTIVKPQEDSSIGNRKGKRWLVQFDKEVEQYGLHCHNEIPNSLWIAESDLSLLKE